MLRVMQGVCQNNWQSMIKSNKNPKINNYSNPQLCDCFQKNTISFKGRQFTSGVYSDDEIMLGKEIINLPENKWKEDLYNSKYKELKENREGWELNVHGQTGKANMNNTGDRIGLGLLTLGLTEGIVQVENVGFRKEAKDYVNKMDILSADLKNMKLKEDVAEIKKEEQQSQHKVNYLKEMHDVKENQLKPKLLDLIQREREGRPTEMPNCIMLSNKNDKINENLIKWTGENVNGKFISIKAGDNLLEHLEQGEENYQNSGDWNLIYVKNMDKLMDHNKSEDWVIESMKDIMSAASEDYHSTLIFSSTHPEDLDSIALQPHRVKKINTEGVKTPEDSLIDDAKERLEDSKTPIETPISAINDLLIVANADKSLKLTWNHSYNEEKQAENVIKNTFTSDEDKHYLDAYDNAKRHLA